MKRLLLGSLPLLMIAVPLAAQERELREANLPRRVEWRLLDFLREERTLRPTPPYRIAAGEVVRSPVGVVGGDVAIAGRLDGDLVVVNGNLVIEDAGVVTGDVTVVGGTATVPAEDAVLGTLTVYGPAGERVARRRDDDWPRPRVRRRAPDDGAARFTVRVPTNYNRVEGLPIEFGPTVRTAGPNPLQLEAFAIWRTHGDRPGVDELGYSLRAEQFVGGRRAFRLGGTAYSTVTPIESAGVSDLEASLAAVLFHADYRDYFDREGWAAYARYAPRNSPVDAVVEFRDERHRTLPAGDPWTLFGGTRSWRLQPLAGEGDYRALRAGLTWNDVPRRGSRAGGTFARVELEQGLGGGLVRPEAGIPGSPGVFLPAVDYGSDLRHGSLDLRRHMRVSANSALSMRGFVAGALGDRSLPPQFQRALGGVGTMPGFGHFGGDCGARRTAFDHGIETVYASYGCDRVALLQLEYAGGIDIGFGGGRWDDDWRFDMDGDPSWVLFMDAGRGWVRADPLLPLRDNTELLVDAGIGLLIEKVGIYAAVPVRGGERRVSFLVRLGRRF